MNAATGARNGHQLCTNSPSGRLFGSPYPLTHNMPVRTLRRASGIFRFALEPEGPTVSDGIHILDGEGSRLHILRPRMGRRMTFILCPGRKARAVAVSDRCVPRPHRGRGTASTVCPGPEAGAVVVFGLTADRKGPTVFPMLRASRWIADCPGSRGADATNAEPVINPDAEFFDTGTWAGGTWLRNAMSERGDDFEAAMGSNPVRSYPAESELPRTHRPPIVDMIEAERVRRQRGRWCDRSGLTLRRSSGGDRGVWRRSSPCRLAGRVWHDRRSRPLANCLPHARFPSAARPARRSGGGKDAPRPLARSAGTFPARPARSRGKPETHRVRFGPPGPRGCPGPPAH